MIKIKVDASVLAALKHAFPKPPNSAQRALDKYVTTLEDMLIESLSRGQSHEEYLLNCFSVSTQNLANKGGQIGSKTGEIGKSRVRLHAWLRDNDLSLVRTVVEGSNLTKLVSQVAFTELVQLEFYEPEIADNLIAVDGVVLEKTLLDEKAESNAEIFNKLFHDYEELSAAGKAQDIFDTTEIDIKSLTNHIKWLRTRSKYLKPKQLDSRLLQARIILAVAQHTSGKFLQRKKASDFGRLYYHGTSVQNVSKKLRSAMLGNCWEYDIRSSVITWKMGFADEWVKQHRPDSTVDKEFLYTKWYLDNKSQFLRHVQHTVFGKNSNRTEKDQLDLLKKAFTALSFGAKKTGTSWQNENGKLIRSALKEIFRVKDERERFLTDQNVNGFIEEQKILDEYFFEGVKAHNPDLLTLSHLQTKSGKPSQAKVIAYLYQHEETAVMNIVRDSLPSIHKPPLANIHDAIILRQRLPLDDKQEIEERMREQTGNRYWRLGQSELKRWESDLDWADVL